MATEFSQLVERMIADDAFCARLVSNPETVLAENGVEATAEIVAAIKGLDAVAIKRLASAFGNKAAAAA
jgi:hypothetical protein